MEEEILNAQLELEEKNLTYTKLRNYCLFVQFIQFMLFLSCIFHNKMASFWFALPFLRTISDHFGGVFQDQEMIPIIIPLFIMFFIALATMPLVFKIIKIHKDITALKKDQQNRKNNKDADN